MEDKTHFKINFRQYLFSIDLLPNNSISVTASNSIEGELYELFNHQLTSIQSRCIVPALEGQQPKTLIANLTYDGSRNLVLEIFVKYDFIPETKEAIVLQRKEIDGDEKLKLLLQQAGKNLSDLQNKLEEVKNLKMVAHKQEKTKFNSNQETSILQLNLTPGDYELTLSWFVHPEGNFVGVQFYIDNTKTDFIPSNGFQVNKNSGSVFYPITLKAVAQLKDKSLVTVKTQTSGSCNFEAKDIIFTAEKIHELTIQK